MGVAPAFLGRFCIETFHGALSFGFKLRHLLQLRSRPQPTSFDVIGIDVSPARGLMAFAPPVEACPGRLKALHEFGHACADEMVLQPSIFKSGAGGGEV